MPNPIELTADTENWAKARAKIRARRIKAFYDWTDLDDRDVVLPYAVEATGYALDRLDDLAGYPLTKETTEKFLDKYRNVEEPVPGDEAIALSRQLSILESFRKQLVGRRSRRAQIIEHQYVTETNRETEHDITLLHLIGGKLA